MYSVSFPYVFPGLSALAGEPWCFRPAGAAELGLANSTVYHLPQEKNKTNSVKTPRKNAPLSSAFLSPQILRVVPALGFRYA